MKQVTRHLCKSFFLTGRQTAVTCGRHVKAEEGDLLLTVAAGNSRVL